MVSRVDDSALSPAERSRYLAGLNRQLRRLDHTRHQATAEFERPGDLLDVGYRTLAQWHRDKLRCSTSEAGRIGSAARALAHAPTAAKRWAAGDIGAEHVRMIASVREPTTEDAFDDWEPELAEWAMELDHHRLRTALRAWRLHADPDGPDPSEADQDAHVSVTVGGSVRADANLDPVGGAAFKDLFDEIVDELFQQDWAEAKDRLGREPTSSDLRRSARQRRHDAFVEIAARARSRSNATAAVPKPLVTVVAGLDALAGGLAELWSGVPLSPRQLADLLADDPVIQHFVYGTGETPISYNPKARLYTRKLREAILARDRRCTGIGCDADTRRVAVAHIQPVSRDGPTTPENGRGACHRGSETSTAELTSSCCSTMRHTLALSWIEGRWSRTEPKAVIDPGHLNSSRCFDDQRVAGDATRRGGARESQLAVANDPRERLLGAPGRHFRMAIAVRVLRDR